MHVYVCVLTIHIRISTLLYNADTRCVCTMLIHFVHVRFRIILFTHTHTRTIFILQLLHTLTEMWICWFFFTYKFLTIVHMHTIKPKWLLHLNCVAFHFPHWILWIENFICVFSFSWLADFRLNHIFAFNTTHTHTYYVYSTNEIIRIYQGSNMIHLGWIFFFFFLPFFPFAVGIGAYSFVLCVVFGCCMCSWNLYASHTHTTTTDNRPSTVNLSFIFILYHFLTWQNQKKNIPYAMHIHTDRDSMLTHCKSKRINWNMYGKDENSAHTDGVKRIACLTIYCAVVFVILY